MSQEPEWQKEVRNVSKGCWEINRSRAAPVCIPPRYKDRLWVTRGQVCTGNQMFQLPASNLFSNKQLIHLSWFQSWFGGFGLNVKSYVNASKNEIKTSRARRICSTFFFLSPNRSVLLSCLSTAVQSVADKNAATHTCALNELTKRSSRMKALYVLSVFLGFQVWVWRA